MEGRQHYPDTESKWDPAEDYLRGRMRCRRDTLPITTEDGPGFELCQKRANDKLHFKLQDILEEEGVFFDLILLMDVIEHVEDYFGFLRGIKQKSTYKLFHIPLNLTVEAIVRPKALSKIRQICGHVHYFTKDLALQALKELEYGVIEHFYTNACSELPARSKKAYFAKLPRSFFFTINKDWAVRFFGGRSLMVLTR